MFRFRFAHLFLSLLVPVLLIAGAGCAVLPSAAPASPTLTADLSTFNQTIANRADLLALTTAQVDANAAAPAPSMQPVVGWYGRLTESPAEDGENVYRFQLANPAGDGSTLALTGANAVLRHRLSTMLDDDLDAASRWSHIWGTMLCDSAEAGGCVVRVSRLRRNTGDQVVTVDTVDGWEGSLVSLLDDDGNYLTDKFVLTGDYPAQYGVEAAFADTTGQDLTARLDGLRDSGRLVRVWGALTCGVSDVNGCRLAVSEIISLPRSTEAAGITQEMVDGLAGVIVMNEIGAPYPVGFKFESGDRVVGVVSSDAFVQEQLQDLISANKEDDPATVRIWGTIYYHDTVNLADDLITVTALEGPAEG